MAGNMPHLIRLCATALTLLSLAMPARGETLDGPGIEAALNDVTIWYEPLSQTSPRQYFRKNGQTPYIDETGTKTYGRWLVRGDKYCSNWPPSERYVCYGVERSTDANGRTIITFLSGGDGKRYTGVAKAGMHVDEVWAQ
jgi:hypothetical protein